MFTNTNDVTEFHCEACKKDALEYYICTVCQTKFPPGKLGSTIEACHALTDIKPHYRSVTSRLEDKNFGNAKRSSSVDTQPRLDGKKFDEGKPMLGLISKSLIWGVGTILTFGAVKYGEQNWRKGMLWSRPYNALLRHLTAWWDGESNDLESGKSHLWHAATELMFLMEYEEKNLGQDDRYR